MAAGGTTIDSHLKCAPSLASIPTDTRNSTPQLREPYHYQPSPPFNQVPEAYSHCHPYPSSPVNSGVVLSTPLIYQGEEHWLSTSHQLGQIRQGTPPPSTTAGPIGVVGVDQYPSYSDYQLFRHDDTIREPIPNGTTTAVYRPRPNSIPRVYSRDSTSGYHSSLPPVNSAVVPPVPLPRRRKRPTTSQHFLDQTYQGTPTLSTTAGPSRGMAVDQHPGHYDYPSGHGDTTHELIPDSAPTAVTASPEIVHLPFHFVSGPSNHPPVDHGVIPPVPATYQNEGNGESTSRQLSQTYQGTLTSSNTPGQISGVSADQHTSRYQCTESQCGANFARRAALNRHHKDKHGPRLVCPGCNSKFSLGRMYRFAEHRQTCPGR